MNSRSRIWSPSWPRTCFLGTGTVTRRDRDEYGARHSGLAIGSACGSPRAGAAATRASGRAFWRRARRRHPVL